MQMSRVDKMANIPHKCLCVFNIVELWVWTWYFQSHSLTISQTGWSKQRQFEGNKLQEKPAYCPHCSYNTETYVLEPLPANEEPDYVEMALFLH